MGCWRGAQARADSNAEHCGTDHAGCNAEHCGTDHAGCNAEHCGTDHAGCNAEHCGTNYPGGHTYDAVGFGIDDPRSSTVGNAEFAGCGAFRLADAFGAFEYAAAHG
jgi:hypothetical protein